MARTSRKRVLTDAERRAQRDAEATALGYCCAEHRFNTYEGFYPDWECWCGCTADCQPARTAPGTRHGAAGSPRDQAAGPGHRPRPPRARRQAPSVPLS